MVKDDFSGGVYFVFGCGWVDGECYNLDAGWVAGASFNVIHFLSLYGSCFGDFSFYADT